MPITSDAHTSSVLYLKSALLSYGRASLTRGDEVRARHAVRNARVQVRPRVGRGAGTVASVALSRGRAGSPEERLVRGRRYPLIRREADARREIAGIAQDGHGRRRGRRRAEGAEPPTRRWGRLIRAGD